MNLTASTTLKLIGASALLGLAAGTEAPQPPDRHVMVQAVSEAAKGAQYPVAIAQVRSLLKLHPRVPEVHAMAISVLAMAGRMDEARAAFEAAKKAFPDLVELYAPVVEEALGKAEAAHRARTEAEEAAARGLPVLAARKLAEAYETLKDDDRLGLQAAQMWAWVKEPVKAALILRRMADKGDPAMVEEADAFLAENRGAITTAAVSSVEDGWKALSALGGDDGAPARAREAFQRAVDLHPDHAGLAQAGLAPMRSPWIGLATVAAAEESHWVMRDALSKGAARGVPAPSGRLSGRAGTALGAALCDEESLEILDGAYGASAKSWGEEACSLAREEKDWQAMVDAFDKANRSGIDAKDALSGFEEAKTLLDRTWDKRFPAASYAQRTRCNIAFLEAWIAASADPVDAGSLDKAVSASAACPTKDFNRPRLDERVAAVRAKAAERDAFTLKVCNRSSKDRISVAAMRERPERSEGLVLQGWWNLDKGKCVELPASFGGADEAAVYLTARSEGAAWWPWQSADASACVPDEKVERPSALDEVACPGGEDLRGFTKLTARRRPGRNGITYNFKDPRP